MDEPTGPGASTVEFVAAGVADLANWVDRYVIDAENREEAFAEWETLDVVRAALTGICHDLETKLAMSIPAGATVMFGGRTFKPTTERRYVRWQNEDLIRAVLDSVLFDPETGEKVDETPAEKLADVYGLKGTSARLTALRARRIEADEYAEVQWGRKRLRDIS